MELKITLCFALTLMATMHQRGSAIMSSGERCRADTDCSAGYECDVADSICLRMNCSAVERICNENEREDKRVCGSNGETYSSLCEMKVRECVTKKDILYIYDGDCVTLPPPANALTCAKMQNNFDDLTMGEYQRLCPIADTRQKIKNKTVTLEDVKHCYRPQCTNEGDYTAKQCHFYFDAWCWCSTSDGVAIDGTLQKNMPTGTCDMRAKCDYHGTIYRDGDVFSPLSQCGFCECLNGSVVCSEEYLTDDDDDVDKHGKLTAEQVNDLKEEILQIFYFQYQHSQHILVDMRDIRDRNIIVIGNIRTDILRWKFEHFDGNNDLSISSAEEHNFLKEVYVAFHCTHFEQHILSLIKNGTHEQSGISYSEWASFFNRDHTDASSSAYALDPSSSSASSSGQNDDSVTSSGSSAATDPIEAPAHSSGIGATPQAPEQSQTDNSAPVSKRSVPRRRRRFVYKLF